MLKKRWPLLLIVLVLAAAFATKPDDKTCIIKAVHAVWGSYVPNYDEVPQFYEQFMDLNSRSVVIDDWGVCKRVRYRYNKELRTVGIGAFGGVFLL